MKAGKQLLVLVWLSAVCILCQTAAAADWPRFRGPNGLGVAEEQSLPVEFGPAKNLLWKAPSPPGGASPAVSGNRVFLTGYRGDQLLTVCLDLRTGKQLWEAAVTKTREEFTTKPNDAAMPSPVADGTNVYVFFPEFGLLSYGLDGNERWRAPLGPFSSVHGLAASPILIDDLVIVVIDQTSDSHIAAFSQADGSLRWKTSRLDGVLGGYSTPSVYRPADGPAQIIAAGPFEVTGYQASTGEKLWWLAGLTTFPITAPIVSENTLFLMEPRAEPPPFEAMLGADKNKDNRLAADEMGGGMPRFLGRIDRDHGNGDGFVDAAEWKTAFDSLGDNGGLVALPLGPRGEIRRESFSWRVEKSLPSIPSALLYRDVLYAVKDGGILTAWHPKTGDVLKQGRLKDAMGNYYASPVAGDGKIYLTSEAGKVTVVKAGADWEVMQVNDLGQSCYASPAIADGQLIIRTVDTLYSFARTE